VKQFIRCAKIINAPMIMAEIPLDQFLSWKKTILKQQFHQEFVGLATLGYEIRGVVVQATDFGVQTPQQRAILIASKIGLPALPGTPPFRSS
jgi:hypothetical protein